MTFRIDETRERRRVSFRLIGRLRGENLPEVGQQIAGGGGSVVLDLDDLTLVDLEVVRFLNDAEGAGIELRNCPPFIRAWIDRERDGGR